MGCGSLVPPCLLHRQHGAGTQQFQHFFIPCGTWQPQDSPTSHVVTLALSTTTEQREKATVLCQDGEAEAGTLVPCGHLSLQFGGTPWAPLWADLMWLLLWVPGAAQALPSWSRVEGLISLLVPAEVWQELYQGTLCEVRLPGARLLCLAMPLGSSMAGALLSPQNLWGCFVSELWL